jgi:hypothetical protein
MTDPESSMGPRPGEWRVVEPPRCQACGDVIGVYEPLVHLGDGFATRTSRAAEPEICSSGQCFHLDCYEQLPDED